MQQQEICSAVSKLKETATWQHCQSLLPCRTMGEPSKMGGGTSSSEAWRCWNRRLQSSRLPTGTW